MDELKKYHEGILPKEISDKLIELDGRFYVYEINGGHWIDMVFFKKTSECIDSPELDEYETFARVSGTTDPLREMRHTYFGEDGYIFYLNEKNMQSFLKYCKKYFDING